MAAHALVLPGVGVARNLAHQLGNYTIVVLAQCQVGLCHELHLLFPRTVQEFAVGRIGNGFLLYGAVHNDLVQALPLDHRAHAAAQMVGANNHSMPSLPIRCRQRVSEPGSMGGWC